MKGDLEVTGYYTLSLKEGSAFKTEGENECFFENKGRFDAISIIAGGHSDSSHH